MKACARATALYGTGRIGMKTYRNNWENYSEIVEIPSNMAVGAVSYALERAVGDRGNKVFELSNHLGNVLATVSDKKLGQILGGSTVASYYEAQVKGVNDYYPFGWVNPARKYSAGEKYTFGFNGQLEDTEWNGGQSVNFLFRVHDPRIGRFLSVDPLAPSYPWYTPYQFAGNTPIWAVDVEGAEPETTNDGAVEEIDAGDYQINSGEDIVVNGKRMDVHAMQREMYAAGQSMSRIRSFQKNHTLINEYSRLRAAGQDASHLWRNEPYSFSSGLQSETAQGMEKIAVGGIGLPLLAGPGIHVFGSSSIARSSMGKTTLKTFTGGFVTSISLQATSNIMGISTGQAVTLANGKDISQANDALFTAYGNIDVGDAVISGINPFNKVKYFGFIVKTTLPALVDVKIGYSGFKMEYAVYGGKAPSNILVDFIGFGVSNSFSHGMKKMGNYMNSGAGGMDDLPVKYFFNSVIYSTTSGNGILMKTVKNYDLLNNE